MALVMPGLVEGSLRRARAARAGVLLALLLAGLAAAGGAAGSVGSARTEPEPEARRERPLRGLSLAEALRELQSRGLALVFTSQLVSPDMRVEAEPAAREPRAALDEILAPHGLRALEAAGATLVIVSSTPAPRGMIAGTVRARDTLAPLAAVSLYVFGGGAEAASDAAGHFEFRDLAPGVYALEARREDFLPERVEGVVVAAGGGVELALGLRPLPFVRDEIVVRPSRLSLLQRQPAAPLALSRRDIERLPHLAGDLFRGLSLLPGVAAHDVTAQFHVRGGRRDEMLILLDGQELYEAYHLPDFDRALSIVDAAGLAAASLSTGAFAASYGDRMSGVLDLTTSTPAGPRSIRLGLSVLSAAAAGGGSFRRGRGDWLASARRGSLDLADRLFGTEDPAYWDLFGKLGARLGDRQHLRVHWLQAADGLDFREAVEGEEKRFDTDYETSYQWLNHQAILGDRLLAETTVSRTRGDRDRRGAETEEEGRFEVRDRRRFDVLGLAQEYGLQASPASAFEWGFAGRRYTADYDYANDLEPAFVLAPEAAPPRLGATRFRGRFRGEHLGLHAAGRFRSAALTAELGLRYDRHPLTRDTLVSPRTSFAWRWGEQAVLRAAWGRFYQSQRPYELQVEDGADRFFPAEGSEQWVLGYERLLGGGELPAAVLRIEVYHRAIDDPRPRYENLFEAVNTFPEVEPDRIRIAPARARSEGIEIVLQGAAGQRIGWWVNYAYASAEDRVDGEDLPRATDQPHTLNAYVSAPLGRHWDLSLAWRFHTGWPTTTVSRAPEADAEEETTFVPVLGPLRRGRLPIYHRLDLRASRRWSLRSGQLTFFADLQNAYSRRNLAGFDFSLDEETGALTREAEAWPGAFPSAGIEWEF